jgi:uncharacterized protein YfkK (UPF0435 family)
MDNIDEKIEQQKQKIMEKYNIKSDDELDELSQDMTKLFQLIMRKNRFVK